jgi:hypothetical protein
VSGATTAALVRPMAEDDIHQVATVTAEAFGTDIGSNVLRSNWEQRLRHSLLTDPDGSFVSEHGGLVTGCAQAVIREGVWILSLMAVSPTLGEGGEGRALMETALQYYRGCAGGLIVSSDDPRAVRGATHTPDLHVGLLRNASFSRLEDRGFVATMPGRGLWILAARDEQAATALLWYALTQLQAEPAIEIGWISGRQQRAIDVLLAARLKLSTYGAIATRGAVGPLYPYIPSPTFA